MTSKIELLPLEILLRICHHLDHVLDFALGSKTCFNAAKAVLYSRIRIQHSTAEALRRDVQCLIDRLTWAGSFHLVHCMILDRTHDQMPYANVLSEPALEHLKERWLYPHEVEGFDKTEDELDQEWETVAGLIAQLPSLSELHYTCIPQVAPCVLEAIESRVNCRLFLGTFRLRSLIQSPSDPIKPSAYDIKLASSPCLHSIISSRFEYILDWGKLDFTEQAALTMASGITPRLKEVSLYRQMGGGSIEANWASDVPHPQWKGTELGAPAKRNPRGALQLLELRGKDICTVDHLSQWAQTTDFSQLRTLHLHHTVGIDILTWLLKADLTSLHSMLLSIRIGLGHYDDDEFDMEAEWEETARLLIQLAAKLPPLDTLAISGQCTHDTIRQILDHQGSSVRKLSVFNSLQSYAGLCQRIDVTSSAWPCPAVEDLSMMIFRTDGDANEVRQYEWLGKCFPSLRRLSLLVNCTNRGPQIDEEDLTESEHDDPQYFRASDGKLYNLQYILRNSAVDGTLAKAIFRTIASSKSMGSPRLERLELRINRGRPTLYPGVISSLLKDVVGHDWVCTPDARDDRPGCIVSRRLFDSPTHESRGAESNLTKFSDRTRSVFHSVWPEKPGQAWEHSWHSFPLAN